MVDVLVHMDPWHIDKSYQCLDDEILVLKMRWFFLIQSYQLSIFSMDDLESMGIYVKLYIYDIVMFCLICTCNFIEIDHLSMS